MFQISLCKLLIFPGSLALVNEQEERIIVEIKTCHRQEEHINGTLWSDLQRQETKQTESAAESGLCKVLKMKMKYRVRQSHSMSFMLYLRNSLLSVGDYGIEPA